MFKFIINMFKRNKYELELINAKLTLLEIYKYR